MKQLVVIGLIVLSLPVFAQETEPVKNSFRGTRMVNGQSANLVEKGKLLLLIQHRFGDISGGFYELFGLDQASMRLGFEYGFGNNFNLGIGRSTYFKTFDLFGKVRLVQQSNTFPFSAVVTAGGSVPTLRDFFPEEFDNFGDKASGNIQIHLAKTMGRVALQLSPGYLRTGYLTQLSKNISFFTMGFAGSVRISKKVSANLEYLAPFHSEMTGPHPLSLGVDLDTGGHLFQLVLSNNQRMFDQAIYTNTTGDWSAESLFFGFNLIRQFNIKYY